MFICGVESVIGMCVLWSGDCDRDVSLMEWRV